MLLICEFKPQNMILIAWFGMLLFIVEIIDISTNSTLFQSLIMLTGSCTCHFLLEIILFRFFKSHVVGCAPPLKGLTIRLTSQSSLESNKNFIFPISILSYPFPNLTYYKSTQWDPNFFYR